MPDSSMQIPVVCHLDDATLNCASAPSDRLVQSKHFKPIALTGLPAQPDPSDPEIHKTLLSSDLGYLFLDRTRIRPAGFAIGEHVHTLSLAPGEEVVMAQSTFSKRETSFEDQNEREQQQDLEMSSTLSTELAEGLDRATNRTQEGSFHAGGSAGGDIEGVKVSADIGYSQNLTEASSQSARRSVKDSSTATSRVASKYRAMHKTVLKVATENRFEVSSRRVVKNPNQYSPVDVHFFKILRRLELTQERWGVRMCWAPAVADPGADVTTRIELERNKRIERALSNVHLPPRPTPPVKEDKPALVRESAAVDADKWQINGGMSAEYDLPIDIPQGYVWNGNVADVAALTRVWGRPPDNMGWNLDGTPWVNTGQLIVRIHVGAKGWLGGPAIHMQAKATFIPDPNAEDQAYQAAYQKWLEDDARWQAESQQALDEPRRAAEAETDAWMATLLANLDPLAELMSQIAKQHFLGADSDEPWEVDFWGRVFDWGNAGLTVFPSWWSTRPARDSLKDPSDFLNASWAKLYLPIRPGYERLALRWILKHRAGEVTDEEEAAITRIVTELEAYRSDAFGDATETRVDTAGAQLQEKFLVLAQWAEVLPTDGTHIEIIQGMTSAADSITLQQLQDQRSMLIARTDGETQDAALKRKAIDEIGVRTPPNVEIRIATEPYLDGGKE